MSNNDLSKIKKEKDIKLISAALNNMSNIVDNTHLKVEESRLFIELKYSTVSIIMDAETREVSLFINNTLKAQVVDYDTMSFFTEIRDAIIARDEEIAKKKAEEAFKKEVEKIEIKYEATMRELDIIFS